MQNMHLPINSYPIQHLQDEPDWCDDVEVGGADNADLMRGMYTHDYATKAEKYEREREDRKTESERASEQEKKRDRQERVRSCYYLGKGSKRELLIKYTSL